MEKKKVENPFFFARECPETAQTGAISRTLISQKLVIRFSWDCAHTNLTVS